jgi:hypothetical protein
MFHVFGTVFLDVSCFRDSVPGRFMFLGQCTWKSAEGDFSSLSSLDSVLLFNLFETVYLDVQCFLGHCIWTSAEGAFSSLSSLDSVLLFNLFETVLPGRLMLFGTVYLDVSRGRFLFTFLFRFCFAF